MQALAGALTAAAPRAAASREEHRAAPLSARHAAAGARLAAPVVRAPACREAAATPGRQPAAPPAERGGMRAFHHGV
jgi:hypothetical protein